MGDKTGIQWTNATWNPIVGCEHVSPGCDNCYAAREASGRLAHLPQYAGIASGGRFTGEVRLLPERLDQPLRWRKPRMIFVNSMSDLFHKDVPDTYIAKVFAVMAACPQHTFQVLTKRHGRMRTLLASYAFRELVFTATDLDTGETHGNNWPLPNVWIGVSVEDQHWAGIRIPALIETPAAVRFLSCEPLLGPVNLEHEWLLPHFFGDRLVDWVIVGGESGPHARPMNPDWPRALRDQCLAADIPYFFKQWGEWWPTGAYGKGVIRPRRLFIGNTADEDGCGYEMAKVGKHRAGRELDGRTWDQYPQAA